MTFHTFSCTELLHFEDGTIGEHCTKVVNKIRSAYHEDPIVQNIGIFIVPAHQRYVAIWKDINPSIRNVTFSYKQMRFVPMKKTARAGKKGRFIRCPHCGHAELVHHFAWSALSCTSCKATVSKLDWAIESK